MLQFETLLLRQLQKQQNRDEFCDTVLHTQGVSVPVHSCVLSAFSPRLYGTLSSMPVPMTGQRRLIQLQAVDACTLLNLVNVLYSGQLHENREQVLSAAQTLGIELPQWQEEARHGGKEKEGADQVMEKVVDARKWDDGMTGRTEEGSGGEKEKIRESGTQTECGRETDERGAQTDLASSEPQSSQTVYVIEQSACSTNQEPGSNMGIHDAALALQVIHPERKPTTCNVLSPETGGCHTVSDSACGSKIWLYSMEMPHHEPSTSVTLHPHNSILDQSLVVPNAEAADINDLKQFEGNIPGFISYFLDSNDSQNIRRMRRGRAREGVKEEQVAKRAIARSTVGGSVREWVRLIGGGRGGRRQRCGLVARLAWQGQGGGRVGRMLQTRSTGKRSMTAFQRGSEALLKAGETRGRGRHGQRGKTGTTAGNQGQHDPPRKRRPRGRPRIRPLPPASRSSSTMMYTVDPTELDLLHTVTPMSAAQMEPIQPIDTLLDDIMTGLNFLPPAENQTNHQGIMSTPISNSQPISKAMYPNSHSVKPTNPKQHLEGELGDILDHFLRTFDQQVGCCVLDVGDETSQGKFGEGSDKADPSTDPWSNTPNTYTQLQSHNPHLQLQRPQESAQPQYTSTVSPSVAEKTSGQESQIHGSEVENPSTDQNIVQQFENRRLTRSQSMKRKLETTLISLQNPDKRTCKEKHSADNKKKRQRDDQEHPEESVNRSAVNFLDKDNKKRATRACSEGRQKQASARGTRNGGKRSGRKKRNVESHRMAGFYERYKSPQDRRPGINGCVDTKKNFGVDHIEAERLSYGFHAGQSPVKSQIGGTCIEIASSAMEKVRMLLQLQNEDDEIAEENLPGQNSLQGHLGEIQEPEDVMVNREFEGQVRVDRVVEVSQKLGDEERTSSGLWQEKMMTEKCRAPFQLNLPSNEEDMQQLAGSSVDEDDDVDVLKVSSPTSELPAVSILVVDLSTEEEEVEDDVEIDVLGLEPD